MPDAHVGRSTDASISGNRLLDAFLREHPSLQSGLQLVTYPAGHVIYRQDRPISYAYFPVAGALALTIHMRDGSGCETTAVGNEGVVGLPSTLVSVSVPIRSFNRQKAARIRSPRRSSWIASSAALRFRNSCSVTANTRCGSPTRPRPATRYTRSSSAPVAGCCSCRIVRVPNSLLCLQSILAEMLGVRRQSVSEVATFPRKKGLIEYRRGHITIVNRKKLEAAACCECYGVMNAYYHRLLPSAA